MAKGKHSKKTTTPKTVVAASTGATATVVTTAAVAPVMPAMSVAPVAAAPVKVTTASTTNKPVVTRQQIAQRAFELFRARGGQHGHAMADWLQAEAELGLGKQ